MELDIKRMKMLREVAERGTITAAAEALSFTPSAVSQQLAALERSTGVSLLEKQGRNVVLTPAGRTLVSHTGDVLSALERAAVALAKATTEVAGTVHIGTFESVVRWLIAPTISTLGERHPGIEVHVTQSDDIVDLRPLRLGEVDISMGQQYGFAPVEIDTDVETRELLTEAMSLAVPAATWPGGDELDDAGTAFLADSPWIVDVSAPCGKATATFYRHLGFEADVRHRVADFASAMALVGHGLGVSLVPQLATMTPAPGVKTIPLDKRQWHRKLFLATRPGSTEQPAIAATCAALAEHADLLAARLDG